MEGRMSRRRPQKTTISVGIYKLQCSLGVGGVIPLGYDFSVSMYCIRPKLIVSCLGPFSSRFTLRTLNADTTPVPPELVRCPDVARPGLGYEFGVVEVPRVVRKNADDDG